MCTNAFLKVWTCQRSFDIWGSWKPLLRPRGASSCPLTAAPDLEVRCRFGCLFLRWPAAATYIGSDWWEMKEKFVLPRHGVNTHSLSLYPALGAGDAVAIGAHLVLMVSSEKWGTSQVCHHRRQCLSQVIPAWLPLTWDDWSIEHKCSLPPTPGEVDSDMSCLNKKLKWWSCEIQLPNIQK